MIVICSKHPLNASSAQRMAREIHILFNEKRAESGCAWQLKCAETEKKSSAFFHVGKRASEPYLLKYIIVSCTMRARAGVSVNARMTASRASLRET